MASDKVVYCVTCELHKAKAEAALFELRKYKQRNIENTLAYYNIIEDLYKELDRLNPKVASEKRQVHSEFYIGDKKLKNLLSNYSRKTIG